jgi:hypothetical protein
MDSRGNGHNAGGSRYLSRWRDTPGMTGSTLRLVCPQWQGAGTSSVRELASEFPFEVARRG